jgi:hypothetical protein
MAAFLAGSSTLTFVACGGSTDVGTTAQTSDGGETGGQAGSGMVTTSAGGSGGESSVGGGSGSGGGSVASDASAAGGALPTHDATVAQDVASSKDSSGSDAPNVLGSCTMGGDQCPAGYECGCGGPGVGQCLCHKQCGSPADCAAPDSMCGCGGINEAKICVSACFCFCD